MTTLTPTLSDSFYSTSYHQARKNWLDDISEHRPRLAEKGWNTIASSIDHLLLGPNHETLATDLLWLGPKDPTAVAVFISATHGIEGFVGNAVQRYLLKSLAASRTTANQHLAFLFVHAINPWGMAWKRRCDENGVDLNRNYIDFESPPINQAYQQLQHCLNMPDQAQRNTALSQHATALGQRDYEIALSGGQYSDPDGPFYGGNAPAHGRRVCEQIVENFSLQEKQLLVIDVHSGLGPWAYGEMISDHPLGHNFASPNDTFAHVVFGPGITNPARGNSSSVAKYGLQDYFWHQMMDQNSCYLTLEFGSYSVQALFDVIINDHRLWKQYKTQSSQKDLLSHSLPADIAKQQIAMLEHFCPQDKYWRQLVLFQAGQTCDRILQHFGSSNAR